MKLEKDIYIIFLSLLCFVGPKEVHAFQAEEIFNEPLKIGLIISDSSAVEAKNGAQLVVNSVNEKGGINGRPVQLITRSMEGPWGSGSKEVVDLVFKEKIWAILGSHDSRNAHLVEQVIAKTRVVFLSAWASDPTLSQAYVPWYFSVVPNDNQQAKVLVKEIYNRRKIEGAVAVLDDSYDSKMAWKSMANEIGKAGHVVPETFFLDAKGENIKHIISEVKRSKTTAVIIIGKPLYSWELIDRMRKNSMDHMIFGNLSILGDGVFSKRNLHNYDRIVLIGSEKWLNDKPSSFQDRYFKAYGYFPGAAAAFAYDGMQVLIEAIGISNMDREKMKDAMMKTRMPGYSGILSFSERGILKNDPELIEIEEGNPVLLEK